jgi:heme/copper-type cytochrome/quinol oxidase subunit 3
MAVAATQRELQGPPVQPALSTGMMGMYIFLASEVMFFGTLFAVYFYLHASHGVWPPELPHGAEPVSWTGVTLVNTAILFSSGITGHFGLESVRHPDRHLIGAVILLVFFVATAAFGVASLFEKPFGTLRAAVAILAQLVGILSMFGVRPFARAENGYNRRAFVVLLMMTIVLGFLFEFGQVYEFANAGFKFTTTEFTSAFFTMTGFHGGHVLGGLIILLLILGRTLRGQFSPMHHVGVAAGTLYWHFVDLVWAFLYGVLYIGIALRL